MSECVLGRSMVAYRRAGLLTGNSGTGPEELLIIVWVHARECIKHARSQSSELSSKSVARHEHLTSYMPGSCSVASFR
jgi:hypothetical protein